MTDFSAVERGFGLQHQYRIERPLGEGGMSEVYQAVQLSLDRPVAIKVMKRSLEWQADGERRFLAEAQIAARIAHPNVVRLLTSGTGELGLYIVFELVEGESLCVRMLRGIALDEVRVLILQACEGLAAIHEAGVVHRDVKPENMLLTAGGVLKLTDLGIAKDLSGGFRTQAGLVFGTPAYMSPEQCMATGVGPAADLYSLGVVLHELAAGALPFPTGGPLEVIDAHLHLEPERPSLRCSKLSREWDEAILKALRKRPEDRYQSADEMAAAVSRLPEEKSHEALDGRGAGREDARLTKRVRAAPARHGAAQATRLAPGASGPPASRRVPAAISLLACGALAGALGLYGPWRERSVAPTLPLPVPATVIASSAASPEATTVFEDLLARVAAERQVEAQLEPLPADVAAPGSAGHWASLFLTDVPAISNAVLHVAFAKPGGPPARGPRPKLTREKRPAGGELAVALHEEPGGNALSWTAPLNREVMTDGNNRFRLEFGAGWPGERSAPAIWLELDRPPRYPRGTVPRSRVVSDAACAGLRDVLDDNWDMYSKSDPAKALADARDLLKQHPDCVWLLRNVGAFLYVALQRRLDLPGGALEILDPSVTWAKDGLQEPTWVIRHEAEETFDRWLRLAPNDGGVWRDYGEMQRRTHRLLPAMRSCRWAVLLDPTDCGSLCHLGCAELELAVKARERGDVRWRGMASDSRSHLRHGVGLCKRPDKIDPGFRRALDDAEQLLGKP